MSNFSVLITTPPYDSSAGASALTFIEQAIAQGNVVNHVFFYQQGVYHANSFIRPPGDEIAMPDAWRSLHESFGVRLLVCITAALKRGVCDVHNAQEHEINAANMTAPFEQAGLGEFFTALHECDQLVQF
ncbi:sulfurtransferase complex subunit TusD [Alteromonas halophila]|nr:sulfurtransferase complex subunit TusD [Alteromonas halophila]